MKRRMLSIVFALLVAVSVGAAEQTLSLFAGVTDDRGEKGFSMGLDYEYKLGG